MNLNLRYANNNKSYLTLKISLSKIKYFIFNPDSENKLGKHSNLALPLEFKYVSLYNLYYF